MALDFSNAQNLSFAAPLVTHPITMAFWGNMDTATTGDYVISLRSSNNTNAFSIRFDDRRVDAEIRAGGSNSRATSPTRFTLGTWIHGAAVFASTTLRTAYLDGGNPGTNTTSRNPSSITEGYIGSIGTANYADGRIAEVGIWNAALTAEEIATLAKGFSPIMIRPYDLVFYAPLIRVAHDVRARTNITREAGIGNVQHPRIYS
jgi:hypothetical protein